MVKETLLSMEVSTRDTSSQENYMRDLDGSDPISAVVDCSKFRGRDLEEHSVALRTLFLKGAEVPRSNIELLLGSCLHQRVGVISP
jgi:hypothetical protein